MADGIFISAATDDMNLFFGVFAFDFALRSETAFRNRVKLCVYLEGRVFAVLSPANGAKRLVPPFNLFRICALRFAAVLCDNPLVYLRGTFAARLFAIISP